MRRPMLTQFWVSAFSEADEVYAVKPLRLYNLHIYYGWVTWNRERPAIGTSHCTGFL